MLSGFSIMPPNVLTTSPTRGSAYVASYGNVVFFKSKVQVWYMFPQFCMKNCLPSCLINLCASVLVPEGDLARRHSCRFVWASPLMGVCPLSILNRDEHKG